MALLIAPCRRVLADPILLLPYFLPSTTLSHAMCVITTLADASFRRYCHQRLLLLTWLLLFSSSPQRATTSICNTPFISTPSYYNNNNDFILLSARRIWDRGKEERGSSVLLVEFIKPVKLTACAVAAGAELNLIAFAAGAEVSLVSDATPTLSSTSNGRCVIHRDRGAVILSSKPTSPRECSGDVVFSLLPSHARGVDCSHHKCIDIRGGYSGFYISTDPWHPPRKLYLSTYFGCASCCGRVRVFTEAEAVTCCCCHEVESHNVESVTPRTSSTIKSFNTCPTVKPTSYLPSIVESVNSTRFCCRTERFRVLVVVESVDTSVLVASCFRPYSVQDKPLNRHRVIESLNPTSTSFTPRICCRAASCRVSKSISFLVESIKVSPDPDLVESTAAAFKPTATFHAQAQALKPPSIVSLISSAGSSTLRTAPFSYPLPPASPIRSRTEDRPKSLVPDHSCTQTKTSLFPLDVEQPKNILSPLTFRLPRKPKIVC